MSASDEQQASLEQRLAVVFKEKVDAYVNALHKEAAENMLQTHTFVYEKYVSEGDLARTHPVNVKQRMQKLGMFVEIGVYPSATTNVYRMRIMYEGK